MGKKRKNSSAEAAESVAKAMQANVRAANAMVTASMEMYTGFVRSMIAAIAPVSEKDDDTQS